MGSNPSVIQLKTVSKNYGETLAAKNVSLDVPQGTVLALLGASGCGKTTTLRLIAGLEMPDRGEIWLNHQQVAGGRSWVPPEDRHVGMVFQDYALFPHLTVEANVAFPLNKFNKKDRQTRIEDMLDLVGLSGLGKRYPHQLSGGQQQRVALARALAPHPKILLLDEPFSNLDTALRKQTREDVYRVLQAAEATTVFVTHDQEEAFSLANLIGVMAEGEIKQIGTSREIYNDPASPEIAVFVGEANQLEGEAIGERVHTVLGDLPLLHPQHGRVTVFIRPENLIISDQGIPAQVERINFLGTSQQAWLRVGEQSLKMTIHPLADIAFGDTIQVHVQGQVVAFPA